MTKELTIQKEDIKQQLQKLREQASTANAQLKKHIDTRNELNQKVKQAREEITALKAERDAINEKVKALKERRDAIRAKSNPITIEINAIKEKIDELKKKLPRESKKKLQEEHDAIEWKISTTPLDLQEEKRLIENVKQLEIQLSSYKKIDVQRAKIKDLIAQRKVFDAEAELVHKEVTELAEKSQALHNSMVEKLNAVKMSRVQADGEHQAYLKTKQEITQIYEKITELSMQLRGINEKLRDEYLARKASTEQASKLQQQAFLQRQMEQKVKEQAIKEKLGAEARSKLEKGEKLSWNEFQLVMGDDNSEDEKEEG